MSMENAAAMEGTYRPATIQWKQIWSLSGLYASIIIGWIAYHNYQPKLLVKFNFTGFAFPLTVAQGIILVITPLVAGRLGDRFRKQEGHRLPIISAGISFAAMIFMAVAFTLIGNPGETFKWILPVLIVLWLTSMSIFTSPALSTVELFTPVDKLPSAMAILTIVANLIYAVEPVIVDIIDYLGAPLTFIAGGTVVFVSGYALKKTSIGLFESNASVSSALSKADDQTSKYGFIFFMGIALGLATSVMFNYFPDAMYKSLHSIIDIEGKWMIVVILVLSAMLSLPASIWVDKFGMEKIFWLSLVVIMVSMAGVLFAGGSTLVIVMVLLFALSFTTLSVSSLPLAINKSNHLEKVFCVGVFFSGAEFPNGIIESILAYN